jgi:hypothetical protein
MDEVVGGPNFPTRDELLSQLEMWLDVYKHHFDLFLKGVAFYLAAAGALGGLIYREHATSAAQRTLSLGLEVFSTAAVLGCLISWRFVARLREDTDAIASAVGIRPFPYWGACAVTLLFACVALGLTILPMFICVGP